MVARLELVRDKREGFSLNILWLWGDWLLARGERRGHVVNLLNLISTSMRPIQLNSPAALLGLAVTVDV